MLLGNIVDLLQKLFDGGPEVRALIDAKHYDIKGTNKGRGLAGKATDLKDAAQALYEAADGIVQAADAPELSELGDEANALASAAMGSGEGLYEKATDLANHGDGTPGLETKANNVITAFDEVRTKYDELAGQAKTLKNLTAEQQQNVKAVDDAYKSLKKHYNGMLNLTKLKYYAGKVKEAAAQDPLQDLKDAAGTLEDNVKNLRDTGENAKTMRDKFNDVKSAFYALGTEKQPNVKDQFQALKGAYGHIGSITFPDLLIPNLNNYS